MNHSSSTESPYNSPLVKLGLYFASFAFAISGTIGAYFLIADIHESWQSQDWPVGLATIDGCRIHQFRDTNGKTKYQPRVSYHFQVNGRTIVGHSIAIRDESFDNLQTAQIVIDDFPVGSTHSVSYNPADPSRCYLRPTLPPLSGYLQLAIPPFMWLLAWLFFRAAGTNMPAQIQQDKAVPSPQRVLPPSNLKEGACATAVDASGVTGYGPASCEFGISTAARIGDSFVCFLFAWFGVFVVIVVSLQEWLLTDAQPQYRFCLGMLPAVVLALSVAWWRFTTRYFRVVVQADRVELFRHKAVDTIASTRVRALFAVPGINLDGGEMIVWKKIAILSTDRNYLLSPGKRQVAACFQALSQVCVRAINVPFRGELIVPSLSDDSRRSDSQDSMSLLCRYVQSQMLQCLTLALALLLGTVGMLGAMVLTGGFHAGLAHAMVWLIVAFVLGVLLLMEAGRLFRTTRAIERAKHGHGVVERRSPLN